MTPRAWCVLCALCMALGALGASAATKVAPDASDALWTPPQAGECPDAVTADGVELVAVARRPGCGHGVPCCAYTSTRDCGLSCDGGAW